MLPVLPYAAVPYARHTIMFAEEEQKLLAGALRRARRDYRSHSNVYGVSAFDEAFDCELKKLVLLYGFDFEAIALHLYFQFPQYAFRMKPQAVSYRWYQLTLQREGERIAQEVQMAVSYRQEEKAEDAEEAEAEREMEAEMEAEGEEVVQVGKREHYEAALRMATCLDQEEEEGFMIYRPKFIVDSEFKLERHRSEDTAVLAALLDNEISFEFGAFCAPQAAPFNLPLPSAAPVPRPPSPASSEEYLQDDWEAYESD